MPEFYFGINYLRKQAINERSFYLKIQDNRTPSEFIYKIT